MSKEIAKNAVWNKQNTNVNNLKNKIMHLTWFRQIKTTNFDKQNLDKKIGEVQKKNLIIEV